MRLHLAAATLAITALATSGKAKDAPSVNCLEETSAIFTEIMATPDQGIPVGRTATAQTGAQMHARILSWSRWQGLFAGR